MSKKKGKTVHKEKCHQLANRSPEEIRAEKVKKCFKRNKQTVRDEMLYDKIFFEGLDYHAALAAATWILDQVK